MNRGNNQIRKYINLIINTVKVMIRIFNKMQKMGKFKIYLLRTMLHNSHNQAVNKFKKIIVMKKKQKNKIQRNLMI